MATSFHVDIIVLMMINFASDHAGFLLKRTLVPFVQELGHDTQDLGPEFLVEGDDYPLIVAEAARRMSKESGARAIIIGGSGQGEAIVANRFPRVRAAVYYGGSLDIVRLSREHNDANVLSLGARFVSEDEAKAAVRLWLETPFSGDERHVRRIAEIDQLMQS